MIIGIVKLVVDVDWRLGIATKGGGVVSINKTPNLICTPLSAVVEVPTTTAAVHKGPHQAV